MKRGLKGKTKVVTCISCGEKVIISLFSAFNKCAECSKQHRKAYAKERRKDRFVKKNCFRCKTKIISKNNRKKYCEKCHKLQLRDAGIKSAQSQKRRSKNEIYFSELCAKKFKNILTNELFFDSDSGKWDADIIIPETKIAILWNGIWHYKKIAKKQSLKQIQIRDTIKSKVIKNNGYTVYVIKDMGKFNKKFVEQEFEKFVKIISKLII